MGPCLSALQYFKMSKNCEARISIFDAAPNGGTLTDPGLIHPALGLAAGGFPVGPGGPKWAGPIYFKALASGPFRSFHRRPGRFFFGILKGRRPPRLCGTRVARRLRNAVISESVASSGSYGSDCFCRCGSLINRAKSCKWSWRKRGPV